MSNINEKSNFECKIIWKKNKFLPDEVYNVQGEMPIENPDDKPAEDEENDE